MWSAVLAGLAMLAAPLLADAIRPGTDFALLVVGFAALVPTQLSRMLAQVLRNCFRPVTYATVLVVNALLDVGFGLLFGIAMDLGIVGILLGILVGETLGALIRLPFVRHYLGRDVDFALLPPLLKFGIPFIPASLATWAFKGADRLVLGTSVAPEELGHYGLAVSLVAPFAMITAALGQAWIPRIAQMDSGDRPSAARATSAAIGWSAAGFGAAAMAAGALAPVVVVIVGGPDYAQSADVLPLLAFGAALAGVGLFTATGLTLMKATRLIPVVTILAAILNIGLLLLLVPTFGLVGAATAVASAYLCLALLTLAVANRVYPIEVDAPSLAVMIVAIGAQTIICTIRPSEPAVWVATTLAAGVVLLAARRTARAGITSG